MNRKAILDQITELIIKFKTEVETLNKLNLTDINIHAENFLIPLLNLAYGWNLKNTNMYSMNSPAIDLEDEAAGVAIQVTSTGTSAKIKKTLVKYKTHHGANKHDQLIILILTKKQKRYASDEIVNHASQVACFDLQNDIIDLDTVLKEIHGLHNLDKIKEILDVLQTELSDSNIELRKKKLQGIIEESFETYQAHLLSTSAPNEIYQYTIKIDRLAVIRQSWKTSWKLKSNASMDKVVRRAVQFLEDDAIPPYYNHGKQIYTFQSIQNSTLYSLCAPGSQSVLNTLEYSTEDIAKERIVIALLKRTLTHDLEVKNIGYRHKEKVYFFKKNREEENREITYLLEKSTSRDVVTPMFRDENGNPKVFKHLSFSASFIRSSTEWFMSIRPTWLFTTNGFKLSDYNADQISEQKRMENNQNVNNIFEFIRYCLNNKIDTDEDLDYSPTLSFQAVPPINVKLHS